MVLNDSLARNRKSTTVGDTAATEAWGVSKIQGPKNKKARVTTVPTKRTRPRPSSENSDVQMSAGAS